MRKKMRTLKLAALSILMTFFLSGCDNGKIYEDVNTDIVKERLADNSVGFSSYISAERYLAFCEKVKLVSIPVIIISIIVGCIIYRVFRNDKPIQKKAIGVLIIGIPVIMLLLVYGSCYLYGKLF